MKWAERLKSKWNIQSDRDFWLIMLTFSLAGMSIMSIRTIIFPLIGIKATTPLWIKILVYIPLFLPIYQLALLFFGFVLGQFPFFWEKEKHLVRFLLGRSKNAKR